MLYIGVVDSQRPETYFRLFFADFISYTRSNFLHHAEHDHLPLLCIYDILISKLI